MISLEKFKILAPTQKLPKTVGDLGKLIVAKGIKKLPKKSPNLVTLGKSNNNAVRNYTSLSSWSLSCEISFSPHRIENNNNNSNSSTGALFFELI